LGSPLLSGQDGSLRYRPAWWLPGRHLRTLWGRLGRRLPVVATRRERLETSDGDVLELDRLDGPAATAPRLVILHGLEGTPQSRYARGMLAEAARRGWGADLMYFRSCAGTLNRARRLYHSGETSDLAFVASHVMREYERAPLVFAGFSLGGNVLLKWLGERGDRLPPQVRGAAAVSVPFDLARGARHIGKGFARIYESSFLRSLKRKTLAKLEQYPDLADPDRLARARSIYEFDDAVTAPVHGFQSAGDYYARSSSLGYLPSVRVPTLLLSAVDDPFLPPDVLGDVRAIAAHVPALTLEFVPRGGHVGFVMGPPWHPFYYAEWRVAEFLAGVLDTA
jgi:predicted alpha/beta-fold hydrolase